MSTFDPNIFGLNADGEITLCAGQNDCCPTVSLNGTPIVPTTVDGQPNYDVTVAAGGDTSVYSSVVNGDITTITHNSGATGAVDVVTDICNKGIILVRDEDGRETVKDTCSELELDRSLHVSSPDHYSGSGKIGSSHSDSDQTAVNAVTTNHNRSVISATNGTTTGQNSIVSGFGNTNSAGQAFVTGDSNVVAGARNHIVGGENNDVIGRSNLVHGRLNVVDGQNNIVSGIQNSVTQRHNIVGGQSNLVTGQANIGRSMVVGLSNQHIGGARSSIIAGEGNILDTGHSNSIVGLNNTLTASSENNVSGGQNTLINTFRNIVSGNFNTVDNTANPTNGDSIVVGQNLTNVGFIQVAVFNEGISAIRSNQTHVGQLFIDCSGNQFGTNTRVFANEAAALAGGLLQGEVYCTPTGEVRIKL